VRFDPRRERRRLLLAVQDLGRASERDEDFAYPRLILSPAHGL
jgi:hypothetical protein